MVYVSQGMGQEIDLNVEVQNREGVDDRVEDTV